MQKFGLEPSRAAYLKDLGGTIPCVSLEFFQNSVLPSLSAGDLTSIVDKLKSSGVLTPERWSVFPVDPCDTGRNEEDTYAEFDVVCGNIIKVAQEVLDRHPTLRFESKPRQTLLSEIRNSSFKIDAQGVLLQTTAALKKNGTLDRAGGTYVSDVSCNCEFKLEKGSEKGDDNIKKVIGCASHILFEDPCRRFMFSVTIENTATRLWFHSRSLVMVTEEFDFIKEHEHLIRFVVTMAFASKEELGYDPSVERLRDAGGNIQYRFRVGDTWYRSTRWLSSFRASKMIGRATRVLEVYDEAYPDGPRFALKDVWLDNDAQTESEIQRAIFDQMNKVNFVPDLETDFRKYFMEIEHDEIVMIGSQEDRVRELIMRGNDLPPDYALFNLQLGTAAQRLATQLRGSMQKEPTGGTVHGEDAAKATPERRLQYYLPKKHYRIVFKHVGQPLDELTDHKKVFGALIDALHGLRCMYSAGYVHRDISAGNLLLCGDICKISDLEYAKPYKAFVTPGFQYEMSSPRDHKTGTPAFMAIEVQLNQFCFQSRVKKQRVSVRAIREQKGPSKTGTLNYNYLHDIESVWWIAVYLLLYYTPATSWPPNPDRHIDEVDPLFPQDVNGSHRRRDFFIHEVICIKRLQELVAPSYQEIIDPVGTARQDLVETYEEFENDMVAFLQSKRFVEVYQPLFQSFEDARTLAAEVVIAIKSWRPSGRKRERVEERMQVAGTAAPPNPKRQKTEDNSV